jgi:hypothetical protein
MRDTDALETPISRAIERVDQCPESEGALCLLFAINAAAISGVIEGLRPGRGASHANPSRPFSRKR